MENDEDRDMSNESTNNGPIGSEIPAELDAVGTLLGLARAFLPNFELPSLVVQPGADPVGPTTETRFLKAKLATRYSSSSFRR